MSPALTRRDLLAGIAAAPLGLAAACRTPAPAGATATDLASPVFPVQPRPPGFHAGMNLAHLHRSGHGYGSASCRAQLQHLVALGVTHVALTPFGYVGDLGSTAFRYGPALDPTLTDAHLVKAAADARSLGLKITLKPHIWSRAFWAQGKSRQDMAPADGDWDAWFQAYTGFALHYARLAEKLQADLYVVGLEYLQASTLAPGGWAAVAQACRQVYGGPLTYAANWWREADAFADWRAFDLVGVNAYHPLTRRPDPGSQVLFEAWGEHRDALAALALRTGRPILFTEAGLQARQGAAAEPWDHGGDGPVDEALQARAYEALLAAFTGQSWFTGVYWWKWFTDSRGEGHDLYAPAGRQAEAVLRRWWAG